ncbi:BLUF domain-containing protein [Frigoribacterium sp. Leaf263]|uniref:BLUF domain-containing protein n=1 Tax=Frigoribacterium sp. Leaf263 TaxID=1736313 RepID=UPI000AD25881|nr:BLUF domain-containing protein [Frigoribacterium sp. Leaf263]
MIVSLTYMSTASTPFDSERMAGLLQQSRENNGRRGLTGMLLYKNGRFMQVLEGAEKDVRERYAVIAADPRHTDLTTLVDESIERRRFPQWSMGVPEPLDADLREAPGYDSFFETPSRRFDIREDSSRAQLLLEWFRRRA